MISEIKHVFNRGVNKNLIFFNDSDKKRFIESLYKFNNKKGALRNTSKSIFQNKPKQEKLVEILKWSLMPNHFHLLLLEIEEGGITEFIKRLANGYTKYINIKYKKSGYLFQNTTKMVLVENDSQYLYIPFYVDLNPLDLAFPNWNNNGIKNKEKALQYLRNNKWSSYYDYQNGVPRDYSCLIDKDKFYELFNTDKDQYEKELKDLIENPIKKFKDES